LRGSPSGGEKNVEMVTPCAETRERVRRLRPGATPTWCCGDRRQSVQPVVLAGQRQLERTDLAALMTHGVGSRCLYLPRSAPEALDFAPAASRQYAIKRGIVGVDDQARAGWQRADEVMELRFYRRQIVENIRVIELEVVENGGTRPVMEELQRRRKRRVVFVASMTKYRADVVVRNPEIAARLRRGPRKSASSSIRSQVAVSCHVPAKDMPARQNVAASTAQSEGRPTPR
jgi:hypothetical protein